MSPEDAQEPTELLDALRTMLEKADPMPDGLVERVRFAVDLAGLDGCDLLDAELARLVEESRLVAARSDEFTRLVTFQSDNLTIMITLDTRVDGTTRVDGWLSPGACHRVELRCPTRAMSTESDDAGRFALAEVPAGPAQLVVHDVAGSHRVVTPPIEIGKGGLSP
ncbi:hypothetical protein [Actinophytocola xanthii]|uniref:Carboxypeptidase regulatory-like domain-containing protein n=1 Tax=Actinophytocola xanthii TaxID=1912961 RepID=A0A1Q8CVU8_9PSEU|nr:hypothetical protein [Actinophytocola xanthii]OLF18477.1 hypothetical protein BU204_05810 [Actinophytocola xanthii]